MTRRQSFSLPEREATPRALYLRRREFIAAGLGAAAFAPDAAAAPLAARASRFSTTEPQSTREAITTYNNFYEFGVGKADPARNAGRLTTRPWSVVVDGLCNKPETLAIDDLIRLFPLEQRVYRHRCVEGWSMVIPWIGFPLASLLARVEPKNEARFVMFETLLRPSEMRGQRDRVLDWPYREGLHLNEAMNPLTLLAVGLYGETLLNQNGAPIRLVTPWKYGFKGIKSIVRIRLQAERPPTTWSQMAPREYGFFANVNPDVDHPRWSQATERRIGEFRRRPTLMYNGYGEHVASMYRNIDLRRYF